MKKLKDFMRRYMPYAGPISNCEREMAKGARAIADNRILQMQFFGMGGLYFLGLAMSDGDGGGQVVTVAFIILELILATRMTGLPRQAAFAWAGVFGVCAAGLVLVIASGVQ